MMNYSEHNVSIAAQDGREVTTSGDLLITVNDCHEVTA